MGEVNLKQIDMFQGLSNMELAKLLGLMDKTTVPAQEVLFEQGDPGDSMYLIQSGKIILYAAGTGDGVRQYLTDIGEGEVLGEMALLTGEARSATAVAAVDTVVYIINRDILDRLVAENAKISSYFIRLLSRRLVTTNSRLQETRETEALWLNQQLKQLDDAHRRFLHWCASIPSVSVELAEHKFGASEVTELQASGKLEPFVRLDSPDMRWLTMRPAARQALLDKTRFFADGQEETEQWAREAAAFYEADGQLAASMEIEAERGDWSSALDLFDRWKETELPGHEKQAVCKLLGHCPVSLLSSRFASLKSYVGYCMEFAPGAGLSILEDALENHASGFSTRQKLNVYEWCADLCRVLGRRQQATEYLQLAESVAGTAAGAVQSGENSEDRLYGLTKQKLARRRSQLLAESAGRLWKRSRLTDWLAVIAALGCIVLFRYLEPAAGLSREGMMFIGIAIAAVIMWIVNIIPDYIVALSMVMLWVLGGVVGSEAALSGFASTSWLFMIFIMALSAVITKSGILYRFALHALKRFPATYKGQLWGIVVGGIVMNPLIPSSSAKVSLGVPLAQTLSESMGFKEKTKGAAGLGLAAMVFYGFTAPFVLTGSYTNVMAYGLVSSGDKPVSWVQWFLYALPAFAVFSVFLLAVLFGMFRRIDSVKAVSAEVLNEQLRLLGPLTKEERITMLAVAGSIGLLVLQPLHGIDSTWVMLAGFAVLVVSGVMDRKTIATGIDWTFLLFLGVAFSFAKAAKELGISEALSAFLGEHMGLFVTSPELFLVAVIAISFAVTLVIRDDPAVILLVSALLPLGEAMGIHPWVLVFVILLSTDPFFFAYQSPTYLTAYYSSEGKAFSHRQGQKIGIGYGAAVLLLALLSVPYWRWLGLIP